MLKKRMFKNLAMASAVSLMPLFGCSTDGMQIYDEYSEGNQTETTSQSGASSDSLRSYQAVGPATFTADPGRLLAAQCAQCHGTDGRSRNGIESLAHEGSGEVIEEMLEMQNSAFTNDIMHQQSRGYSEREVRLSAAWFDTQRSNTSGNDSDNSDESFTDDYDDKGNTEDDDNHIDEVYIDSGSHGEDPDGVDNDEYNGDHIDGDDHDDNDDDHVDDDYYDGSSTEDSDGSVDDVDREAEHIDEAYIDSDSHGEYSDGVDREVDHIDDYDDDHDDSYEDDRWDDDDHDDDEDDHDD